MFTCGPSFFTSGGNDPFYSSVIALLHCEGANNGTSFIDVKGSTWTRTGAVTSTTHFVAGVSGGFVNGSSQVVTGSISNLWQFGTGDWTIEGWFYFNSVASSVIVDFRAAGTDGAYPTIFLPGAGGIDYYSNTTNRIVSATGLITTGVGYHIAVARVSSVTRLFVNGTQAGSNFSDTTNYNGTNTTPHIGQGSFGTGPANMYFDEIRVTKGVGRYSANFTVPHFPFPNS